MYLSKALFKVSSYCIKPTLVSLVVEKGYKKPLKHTVCSLVTTVGRSQFQREQNHVKIANFNPLTPGGH